MSIEYKKEYSFRAEVYWRDSSAFRHRVGASMDDSTIFKTNDGWLFAGEDNYTKYNGAVRVRAVIKMDFWFGCYMQSGKYFYDVRCISLTRDEPFFAARLELSRNGYLGLYIPENDRSPPTEAQLWQLDSFDPKGRRPGDWMHGLTLRNARGQAVKRLYKDNFPYLSVGGSGEEGSVTMNVVQVGEGYPFP